MDAQAEEKIRQVLCREMRTDCGQRALAWVIGVGRSVLRKFVEMRSVPTAENMQKTASWIEDRPEVVVPIGSVCLTVLVAGLRADRRYTVRREIAQVLAHQHLARGEEVPEWLRNEITER